MRLKTIKLTGTLAQNGFDVKGSSGLTLASLRSILNALKDYSEDTSGTTWTVTLGAANIAKLTEADLLLVEQKGWVLA